jgi:hypothetical protein
LTRQQQPREGAGLAASPVLEQGRPHSSTKIDGKHIRLDLIEKGEAASQRTLERVLRGADHARGGRATSA